MVTWAVTMVSGMPDPPVRGLVVEVDTDRDPVLDPGAVVDRGDGDVGIDEGGRRGGCAAAATGPALRGTAAATTGERYGLARGRRRAGADAVGLAVGFLAGLALEASGDADGSDDEQADDQAVLDQSHAAVVPPDTSSHRHPFKAT